MIHISSQFLYVFHLFLLSSSFSSYVFLLLLSTQAVPFEINLGKNKWLVISVYRPPNQNSQCFLNELDKTIDCFSVSCDIHVLVIGDFNLEPSTGLLKHSNALYNWIKMNTCFKAKELGLIWFWLIVNIPLKKLILLKQSWVTITTWYTRFLKLVSAIFLKLKMHQV